MKKRSLLKKMAVIALIMAVLAILLSAAILYFLFRRRAVQNMNENLKDTIGLCCAPLYETKGYDWAVEYWRKHEAELEVTPYGGSLEEFMTWSSGLDGIEEMKKSIGSRADIEALPPEDQRLYAEYLYFSLFIQLSTYREAFHLDEITLFAPEEDKNSAYCFISVRAADNKKIITEMEGSLGKNIPLALKEHPEVQKLLSEEDFFSDVEIYRSGLDNREYASVYERILPVKNEPVLIAVTQSMDELMHGVWADVNVFEGWIILIISIAIAVMLLSVYLGSIRPTEELQEEIRSYAEKKDRKKLTERLEKLVKRKDEIGRLSSDVNDMACEIEEHFNRIVAFTAEKERIGAELDVASRIQMGVLPKEFPAFPDHNEFDIYASMTPAKEVGGDLYDFYLMDEDHLVLVIGDVSGKGVPAALFMITEKALIKSAFMNGMRSPAAVLSAVNNRMCEGNEESMFVTTWIGLLKISTGEMICANAGHEYPLIKREGEDFAFYRDEHGIPVGSLPDMDYEEYTMTLAKGDILFVYTDGVPEAHNSENVLFGEEAMLSALNTEPEPDPKRLVEKMTKAVAAFAGDREAFDDVTMLCFRFDGKDSKRK